MGNGPTRLATECDLLQCGKPCTLLILALAFTHLKARSIADTPAASGQMQAMQMQGQGQGSPQPYGQPQQYPVQQQYPQNGSPGPYQQLYVSPSTPSPPQHLASQPAQYPQQPPQASPQQQPVHTIPQQQQQPTQSHQAQGQQAAHVIERRPDSFKTSLYGCFTDVGVCCCGTCCLSCLYGDNVSRVQGTGCCWPCLLYQFCPCFACVFGGRTRQTIRIKYNLHEAPCSDFCVHCWCSPCAVCQETRELKRRS